MKKVLLAGLAVSALAFTAPSASATHFEKVGGCGFIAVTDQVAGQGQMTGVMDGEMVVYSTNPTSNPVSATLTCYITVNGAAQPGATIAANGTVVVAGGGVVTYTSASDTDDVQLCETVTYTGADGSSETTNECFESETFEIPPPILWEIVDPAVCPVFAAITGTYGPVFINNQGDIYVGGEPQFDCPPYDIVWP